MMQHKDIQGARMAYRKVFENELTVSQRSRIYEAKGKAEAAISAMQNLKLMASNNVPNFEVNARWVVATCRIGTEESIADELRDQNIDSWCPLGRFRKRPRRGLKSVDYFRPLFRGYLFARVVPCHEAYAGLLSASRLLSLMGRDGKPYIMPERLMNALMLATKKHEYLQEDEVKVPYSPGDTVKVLSGPFASFQMIVRAVLPTHWKVSGEVEIFGRMTPIELDLDSVERQD